MSVLTKDRAITIKGARALFTNSFVTRRRRLIYPKLVEVIDSYVETDFAKNIGTVPQLTEIINDVNAPMIADFKDYSWTWTNRTYSAKLALSRKLLDYDQTGQTRSLLNSMAARLANLPDLIIIQRIQSNTGLGGDGVALLSTTHPAPIGSAAVQNNILTGTTPTDFCSSASVQTVAQAILVDYRNAIAQMRGFLDDNGQPWHDDDIRPEDLVILCSPLLEAPMKQAFFSKLINASDNVLQGMVREVITSNYLPITGVTASDWYLCHVGEMKRPFIYSRFRRIRDEEIQDKVDSSLTSYKETGSIGMDDLRELSSIRLETNMGMQGMNADSDVIMNDRFMISAQWMGEIFPGEWRNIIKVDNPDT